MHIGNAKAALNEYLTAKSQGGAFLLRIEDTDQKREIAGAVDVIYKTLEILGIKHDEGPDIGGGCGPYVQSERNAKGIYIDAALELVQKGKAYYCFCSRERLETLVREGTQDAVSYDRHCLGLPERDIDERIAAGEPYVIRQIIPEGKTTFTDEIFGAITVNNSELDDQVLIKSDGFPTYNFANVVDDNAMMITHVVRGTEYLSSTPKYNLLYEAFDWKIPKYIHVPMILNEEGKKYSKRSGAPSIEDMVNEGYLPEAIINFIALLGWSPADNREFFTLKELEEHFSISGLSKSPSVVDMRKLQWMNAEYFKRMDFERFYAMSAPIIENALSGAKLSFDTHKLAQAVQSRVTFLNEVPEMLDFLPALPNYDITLYENKKQKTDVSIALSALEKSIQALTGIPAAGWQNDRLYAALQNLAAENGLKNSQILWPVRIALSGKLSTPVGATELLELLGKDESLVRITTGIESLRKGNAS
ncbi:MAG: glutamate--tRNA ligase [Defluviitaleaceae bacterium]|nr:glutamate--tRNA ligase [Defluviitaleaceae bacterium]MCL2836386.1 glutamate--tRNA ligase [Defluviitaleaceae bacterium]